MPPYPTNDMAHIRDIRPSALEIKFLLDPATAAGVADWARANLAPDPNGTGAWGDEYLTTSLYFDNASYDVFHRRGSFGRSKYRIRRYGERIERLPRAQDAAARSTGEAPDAPVL